MAHQPSWFGAAAAPGVPTILTDRIMKMQTTAGLAGFYSTTNFTAYIGRRIAVTYANKTIQGWIKAAGTTEATTELISNGGFETGTSGWTAAYGAFIFATSKPGEAHSGTYALEVDINAPASHQCAYRRLTNTSGWLLKYDTWSRKKSSNAVINLSQSIGLFDLEIGSDYSGTYTNQAYYLTAPYANGYVCCGADGISLYDDISVKHVTTLGATYGALYGFTVVSAQNGSTYNWTSNEGIDVNAPSYTVTIYV